MRFGPTATGAGLEMSFRILREDTAVLGRGLERFVFRPWGIAGGRPGARCRVILNRGSSGERDLGKLDMFVASAGDVVTILTAGGGGFGDPYTRAVEAVLRDVRAGIVSPAAAVRDHGVVIDQDGVVDEAATRQRRNRPPPGEKFGFGAERRAWELVFDDAITTELATRLLEVPATARSQLRRRIIEAVVPGIERVGEVELEDLITNPPAQRAHLRRLMDSELPPL